MKSKDYKPGISCPYCIEKLSLAKKYSLKERQHQIELARHRGELHIGKVMSKQKEKSHG